MRRKRAAALLLTVCMTFTGMFCMAAVDVNAAVATPAKVAGVKAKATSTSTIKLTWKEAKNASGYRVYQNGKKLADTKKLYYLSKKLSAGTKYTYKVRAYKSYKQKQYYNKSTKKWQAKRIEGARTKTVSKKKFGAYSKAVTASTKKPVVYPSTETIRNKALAKLNKFRYDRQDIDPYIVDPVVEQVAQERAEYMQKHKVLSHNIKDLGGSEKSHCIKAGKTKKDVWFTACTYAKDITDFRDKEFYSLAYTESNLPFGQEVQDPNYTHIGIGYYKGYICIITYSMY